MTNSEISNFFLNGYYNEKELCNIGFGSIGNNVKIAKNSVIVGPENIHVGNNVIIDSFCSVIASGPKKIKLGSFVHIGSYCFLLGSDGIELGDFSGLSQGVKIYSKTDDYSGQSMTNPTIPSKYKSVKRGKVVIEKHVIIGANTVILPNIVIGEGVSVGALSLVATNLDSWTMYFGNPLKKIFSRSKKLLELKEEFLKEYNEKLKTLS